MWLPQWVLRRPVLAGTILFMFSVFVALPTGIAGWWAFFSDEPFAAAMARQNWGWLVIGPLYGWFSLALIVICAALLFVILGATLQGHATPQPPAAPALSDEQPLRILERYYQRLLILRGAAEEAKPEGDLYAVRARLNEIRGELISLKDRRLSPAAVADFQTPNTTPFRDPSNQNALLPQERYQERKPPMADLKHFRHEVLEVHLEPLHAAENVQALRVRVPLCPQHGGTAVREVPPLQQRQVWIEPYARADVSRRFKIPLVARLPIDSDTTLPLEQRSAP